MKEKYFTCTMGPVEEKSIETAFDIFTEARHREIDSINIVTSRYIDKERFDVLRQINLIDTQTLKRMLK